MVWGWAGFFEGVLGVKVFLGGEPHGVHLLQILVKPILTYLAVLPSMIMYKNNTVKVEWIRRKKVQKTVII